MGQYLCDKPTIDFNTQQPLNCQPNNTAQVKCTLIPGLQCEDTKINSFNRSIPCYFTNGYNFETALLLSIFLGMFGADRFYLGYPAIGLLKFSTLGGCFLFQLVDILLIAMQLLRPADGSHYVMKYFGPRLTIINTVEDFALIQEDLIEYMPIKTL